MVKHLLSEILSGDCSRPILIRVKALAESNLMTEHPISLWDASEWEQNYEKI
jgi:hypothetical protein